MYLHVQVRVELRAPSAFFLIVCQVVHVLRPPQHARKSLAVKAAAWLLPWLGQAVQLTTALPAMQKGRVAEPIERTAEELKSDQRLVLLLKRQRGN